MKIVATQKGLSTKGNPALGFLNNGETFVGFEYFEIDRDKHGTHLYKNEIRQKHNPPE